MVLERQVQSERVLHRGPTAGVHQVLIHWGSENVAGKYINLDAVDIVGTILYPPATITKLSPSTGPGLGGNKVVITGKNFYGVSGPGGVRFDGLNATSYTLERSTQITAVAPPRTAAKVRVQVYGSTGSSRDTAANDYTYQPAGLPTVTSLALHRLHPGWRGRRHHRGQPRRSHLGHVRRRAGRRHHLELGHPDHRRHPAHGAGTVQVQVTTPAGSTANTAADDFTYAVPGVPTITSLSPATGSVDGGTSVIINGTNFAGLSGASAVTFGGVNATSYHVNSGTKITAVAPAHAAGAVRVQVTAVGGTTADTANDDFTYTTAPPVTRYDQTNANIVKTGTWADFASPGSYGGSYGRSSTAGASATIWFTGTQLDYIAMKGTTTGYADIYVDGVKVTGTTPVNLAASPAPSTSRTVWTTGPLANGLHSVKIVRSASSAAGKY